MSMYLPAQKESKVGDMVLYRVVFFFRPFNFLALAIHNPLVTRLY